MSYTLGKGSFGSVTPYIQDWVQKTFRTCEDDFYSFIREVAFYRLCEKEKISGVIPFHGFGSKCIFLERALHDLHRVKFLDHSKLDRYVEQIVSTLAQLHARCVLHRDLKPSNLLVDVHGRVRLCDLGSLRLVPAMGHTVLTNPVCTLDTRAPEIVLGNTRYTDKSDVWSLGMCVLSMCLSNRSILSHVYLNTMDDPDELGMLRVFCLLFGYEAVRSALGGYSSFRKLERNLYPQLFRVRPLDYWLQDGSRRKYTPSSLDTLDALSRTKYRPATFSPLVFRLLTVCLQLDPKSRPSIFQIQEMLFGSQIAPAPLPIFSTSWPRLGLSRNLVVHWPLCYGFLERYKFVLNLRFATLFSAARLLVHNLNRLGGLNGLNTRVCLFLSSQIYETNVLLPRDFQVSENQVYKVFKLLDGDIIGDHEQLYVDLYAQKRGLPLLDLSTKLFGQMVRLEFFTSTPLENFQNVL